MSRDPLPPPPPPPHLRIWPDRAALLADRARALEALRRRNLPPHRLGQLWLVCLLALCGWAAVAGAVQMGSGGFPDVLVAACVAVLGLAFVALAVVLAVLWVRRERRLRELLDHWLALDTDTPVDARLRAPGLSAAWMLLSFVPCALGLWSSFGAAASADSSDALFTVPLGMGGGVLLWVTGLLGIHRAVRHRRWALSRLVPVRRA